MQQRRRRMADNSRRTELRNGRQDQVAMPGIDRLLLIDDGRS
jgi:hypothetical protein